MLIEKLHKAKNPSQPYTASRTPTSGPSIPAPGSTLTSPLRTPLTSTTPPTPGILASTPLDRFWRAKLSHQRYQAMLHATEPPVHPSQCSYVNDEPARNPPKLPPPKPEKRKYEVEELLEIGKKSHLDERKFEDMSKKMVGRSSRMRLDGAFGPALTSKSNSHTAESTAIDDEVLRNPIDPPSVFNKQKEEGFVQFLRQYSSPTHNRVTAGGRIVPAGPPPKRLSFSGTNNNRHAGQRSNQYTQDFLKNVRTNKPLNPETNHQDVPNPFPTYWSDLSMSQGPGVNYHWAFPMLYQQPAPSVAPIPTIVYSDSSPGYTVIPTQELANQNNAFLPFPGGLAPPPQQYMVTDPTAFGHQVPFANVPNGVTSVDPTMSNHEEVLKRIEQHQKTLETGHARIERWYALNGPSLSEPARNEFFGQRRNYNIGRANLRTIKENLEKLSDFHPVYTNGVSSYYGGSGSRPQALTTTSGTLNIWGERVVDRQPKSSSANARFSDVGPIPFKLGADRDNTQTSPGNGFQDLRVQTEDDSVNPGASKHGGESSEYSDQATPTASQRTPKPTKQTGSGTQSSQEKAKEWARRCHARGIKIESPSELGSPLKGVRDRANTGSSSGYIPICYQGEPIEGNISDSSDLSGEPLRDRSNEQAKAGGSQYNDSGDVEIVYHSPDQVTIDPSKKGRSRPTRNATGGQTRLTGTAVDPVSENRSIPKRSLRNTYNSRYFEANIAKLNEEFEELNVSPIEFKPGNRGRAPRNPPHRFLDGANDEISGNNHFVEDWENCKRERTTQHPTSASNGPYGESDNGQATAWHKHHIGSRKAKKTSTETRVGKTRYTAMQDNVTASGAMGKPHQSDAQKEFLRTMLKNPRYSAAGEGDFDFQAAIERELRNGNKPRAPARTQQPAESKPNNGPSKPSSMGPPPHVNKAVYNLAASVGMAQEYHSEYDGASDKFQSAKNGGTDPRNTIVDFSSKTASPKKSSAATSQTEDYTQYFQNSAGMSAQEKMDKIAHHKEVSEFFKKIREQEREEIARYQATHE